MKKNHDSKVNWDDPQVTIDSRDIIKGKPLLSYFYSECYQFFSKELPPKRYSKILELGSGAGFIKEFLPHCITSDVLDLPFIDKKVDALSLPFQNEELDGICMIDVFHHIPDVAQFLREATRVLKKGGKLIMIEPSNTTWARFIYQNFHHEPFLPTVEDWKLPEGGPMTSANGALPWIVFKRDWNTVTKATYSELELVKMDVKYPLIYLLSGGLSWPQLLPSSLAIFLDKLFPSGMFYEIVLKKS